MKNKIKTLILNIMLAAAIITVVGPASVKADDSIITVAEQTDGEGDQAYADTGQTGSGTKLQKFSYEDATKTISGTLKTTGIDEVTRFEFYYSDSYDAVSDNVSMFDSNGRYVHLNGENVVAEGTLSGDAQVYYGGQTTVSDYGLKCIVYYITATQDTEWTIHIIKDDSLKECFVAKSQVPTDWSTITDGLITKPLSLEGYYINPNTSLFTNMGQVNGALNANAVDQELETFKGEMKSEEEKDPVKTMLIVAIILVSISIVVTMVLIKKDKAKKEEKRRNNSVKEKNERMKKQKKNENKALRELIDGYNDEYNDDDYEEGPIVTDTGSGESSKEETDFPYSKNAENIQTPTSDSTDFENYSSPQPQQIQMPQQQPQMQIQNRFNGQSPVQNQTVPPYENGNANMQGYLNSFYGQNMNPHNIYINQNNAYANYPNIQTPPERIPTYANNPAINVLRNHTRAAYPAAQGYVQQMPKQPGYYNGPNAHSYNGVPNSQVSAKRVPAFARKG